MTDRCALCNTHRVLTAEGKLFLLAVHGPKRDYVCYICEDCVKLFNTAQWPRTKKALLRLRHPSRLRVV
jgi:hypothetical protein